MITIPHPSFRLATALGICLVLVLGAMTFTRAAEKDSPPETTASPATTDTTSRSDDASHLEGIQILKEERARIDEKIQEHREILNHYRKQLKVTDSETEDPFTSRKTQEAFLAARLEAQTTKHNLEAIHQLLHKLKFADQVQTIPTAFPDELLNKLLERKAQVELKLEELSNTFTSEHPEVRSQMNALQALERQIRERVSGIMLGLKTKLDVLEVNIRSLDEEMSESLNQGIARAIERRPYFEHKRSLENLEMVRDRITLRIAEEEMEAAFKKSIP